MLLRKITDFQEILPIIENLRKPSVKPRHWQEIMTIAKTSFPYELESFSLADIMDSPILQFKDDVEEVGDFVVRVKPCSVVFVFVFAARFQLTPPLS